MSVGRGELEDGLRILTRTMPKEELFDCFLKFMTTRDLLKFYDVILPDKGEE